MSKELCTICMGSGATDSDSECWACHGSGFKKPFIVRRNSNSKNATKLAVEAIERAFAERDEHEVFGGIGA